MKVRTRFAPSPTGFQHIGGFRTAIYAWLLARHFDGKFLLRIEDTDQERRVPGAIKYVLESFKWLGIEIDEGPSEEELSKIGEPCQGLGVGGTFGPYIQSLRLPRYREIAEELIKIGVAYRCDCTSEMLERERFEQMARKELPGYSGYCRTRDVPADKRHVVRFKMPHKVSIRVEDGVKGLVSWDSVPMRDPVLLKSDNFPTYHLAVVVDDHDMEISHVLRGDEWLSSLPLHVLLYDALGWEKPKFCHLPVVLGSDGKKLSKRHGATSLEVFKEQGYLSQALVNYTTLVGWSPGEGEEQEVFTREELIQRFSVDHINNASAVFDYNKLNWMNGIYLRNSSDSQFTEYCQPYFEKAGFAPSATAWAIIAPHVKERVRTLPEVPPMVEFLCRDQIHRDLPEMFQKGVDKPKAIEILRTAVGKLSALATFEPSAIEAALRALAEELGLKVGPVFVVLRIAVTGKKVTPPLFESFAALGKEKTLRRLEEATIELQKA